MKYIKSMEIINFQSHKNTSVNFENGLNVISGPSDNGKSAIIRALKWVLYNEPKGTDFIRQGETNCRVSISLSDGKTIIRERTKSKNQYRVIDQSGGESVFEGFGNEIPEEILKAHGITRLFVDAASSQSINLSEQLEGPFLLSQPGSVKAKAIGRLVGVHIVDEALKEMAKELTSMASEERNLNSNLSYLNEKLKDFESLYKKKEEIDRKEILLQNVLDRNERLKRIGYLKQTLSDLISNTESINEVLAELKDLDNAETLIGSLKEKIAAQNRIVFSKEKYVSACEGINDAKIVLEKTQNINEAFNILIEIDKQYNCLEKLKNSRNKLSTYNYEINYHSSVVSKLRAAEKAGMMVTELENCLEMNKKLRNISEQLNIVNDRIMKGEDYIYKFKHIENAHISLTKSDELLNTLSRLKVLKNRLSDNCDETSSVEKELRELDLFIESSVEEYMVLLKEMGKCPVCMSPIEDHTIDLIINEFKGDEKHEQL